MRPLQCRGLQSSSSSIIYGEMRALSTSRLTPRWTSGYLVWQWCSNRKTCLWIAQRCCDRCIYRQLENYLKTSLDGSRESVWWQPRWNQRYFVSLYQSTRNDEEKKHWFFQDRLQAHDRKKMMSLLNYAMMETLKPMERGGAKLFWDEWEKVRIQGAPILWFVVLLNQPLKQW